MLLIWGRPVHTQLYEILKAVREETKGTSFHSIRPIKNDVFVTCINTDAHGGSEVIPSLSISKTTGVGHCFGCNQTYDLPTIIAKALGLDNRFLGFKWLARKYVIGRKPDEGRPISELQVYPRSRSSSFDEWDKMAEWLSWEHPYAIKRGLTREILEQFRVGYDSELNALTIPICNANSKVLYILNAMIASQDRKFGKYRVPAGVDKDVLFGLDHVIKAGDKVDMVYLVEGPIDTMYCWVAGKYAAGVLGSTLLDKQAKQYLKYLRKPVVIFYDNPALEPKVLDQIEHTFNLLYKHVPLYLAVYPDREDAKDPNTLTLAEIQNLVLEEL